jgi:DNA-binding transcriptional regulator YiaG
MSRLTAELFETAAGMHANDLLPDATYDKITMRRTAKKAQADTADLTGDEIRGIRERPSLKRSFS